MKMRKLLAGAVAASVAVTSLATVASAAEKEFQMGYSIGTITYTTNGGGIELGDKYYLDDEEFETGSNTLGITSDDSITVSLPYGVSGLSLKVTGVKGTRGSASKTYTYAFTPNDDGTYTLPVYADKAPLDGFLPEQFLEITKLEVAYGSVTNTYLTKTAYEAGLAAWGTWVGSTSVVTDFAQVSESNLLAEISAFLADFGGAYGYWASIDTSSTTVRYPFMPTTGWDGDDILTRYEIDALSISDAYNAANIGGYIDTDGDGVADDNFDGDQSYNDDDTTDGTVPYDFAGLASQVADFFNKQTNGTITFKFTTAASSGSSVDWVTGGVPSTQTGIKNYIGDSTANDFALFFNYDQTGSLQAVTELDKEAGTVTFNISDVLDAMGGQTLGVIDNIYYGLRKGLDCDTDYDGTNDSVGLFVESIVLAYDEDGDVAADIEDEDDADVEIEEDDDVEIEEDDDVEIEDDADDAEEDDAATDGDVIVETEDDDANPGTGVALAVVPAMVAAAAVVLSKKRK